LNSRRVFQLVFAAAFLGLVAVSGLRLATEMLGRGLPEGILYASGRIEGDEVNVASKVAGRLDRLLVREGQRVARGEVIARLDSAELEARLAQAEATQAGARMREAQAAQALSVTRSLLAQSEAEAVRAASDHRRYEQLLAEGVVSRSHFERAEAEQRVTQAAREAAALRVREAEAALQAARAQVRFSAAQVEEARCLRRETEIRSPLSGTVTEKVAEEGEVVSVGAPIVTLVDLDRLYLKVYLQEALIGRLRLNDEARVFCDAFPDRPFGARVCEVSDAAEFTPKSVETREERVKLVFAVKLRLGNPEGRLKPGLPADALIRTDPKTPWPQRRP
jgi:HlyD family secretion protein